MPYVLPETRLVHALLRLHGRSADGFSARFLADGAICITGPGTAVFYTGAGWTSRFLRHVHQGYFDAVPAAVEQHAAFAS
jgi:hypothetical protein